VYEKFIARQPIFDDKLRVFAYELLFRAGGEKNVFQPRPEAASSVIVDSMMLYDALLAYERTDWNALASASRIGTIEQHILDCYQAAAARATSVAP
jgi:hypothetical protein